MILASRPLVEFTRGTDVESTHNGWLYLSSQTNRSGTWPSVFVRSTLKPFQALPLLVSGAADAFAVSDGELALICSSHSGQPYHTVAVERLLARAGIPHDALKCGAHPPLRAEDAAALQTAGKAPSLLHNNCSGKHAGFLIACRHLGLPLDSYLDHDHPLQQMIREHIAKLAGLKNDVLPHAVDGCSAPTYALPLDKLATLFAEMAKPTHEDLAPHLRRLANAIGGNPRYLSGDGRFDQALISSIQVVCKGGAEAVHAGVHAPSGTAWAVKIADGSRRAVAVAVIGALTEAGLLNGQEPALAPYRGGPLLNHVGIQVGESRYIKG